LALPGRRAFRAAQGRLADCVAQQIGQFVRVVMELLRKRRVLVDELDGHRERSRHAFIVRAGVIVAIELMMDRADFEYVSLQGDADGNLFPAHDRAHHFDLWGTGRSFPMLRPGMQPTTLSALRHAAACGAGSGGSYGASGGLSGLEGVGTLSLRIAASYL
jgi:hypothetical protein